MHTVAQFGSVEAGFHYEHAISGTNSVVTQGRYRAYELFCLISGRLEYRTEGDSYQLGFGDIAVVRTDQVQTAQPVSKERSEWIVIHFLPRYLRGFESSAYNVLGFLRSTMAHGGLQVLQHNEHVAEFFGYLEQIEQYIVRPVAGTEVMIRTLFLQALVCLNRAAEQIGATPNSGSREGGGVQYDPTISEIIRFIESNPNGDLSLGRLESLFGLSRYHMCRLFKQNTGYTVHEYVTNIRVMQAVTLLNEGATALEAAYAAGFHDYSNFYKSFSRVTGFAPHRFSEATNGNGR